MYASKSKSFKEWLFAGRCVGRWDLFRLTRNMMSMSRKAWERPSSDSVLRYSAGLRSQKKPTMMRSMAVRLACPSTG